MLSLWRFLIELLDTLRSVVYRNQIKNMQSLWLVSVRFALRNSQCWSNLLKSGLVRQPVSALEASRILSDRHLGDLQARVGLHSGPVVAGVLRGTKARFQVS